jgi:hypothetical protein
MSNVGLILNSTHRPSLHTLSFILSNGLKGPTSHVINLDRAIFGIFIDKQDLLVQTLHKQTCPYKNVRGKQISWLKNQSQNMWFCILPRVPGVYKKHELIRSTTSLKNISLCNNVLLGAPHVSREAVDIAPVIVQNSRSKATCSVDAGSPGCAACPYLRKSQPSANQSNQTPSP